MTWLSFTDRLAQVALFNVAWSQVCAVSSSILASSDSLLAISLPLLWSALISFQIDSILSQFLIDSAHQLAIAMTLQACKNLNEEKDDDDLETRVSLMGLIFALREGVETDAKALKVSSSFFV